ncbi:MAG: mandelate racemase [Rhizobiales bacterium]|nr:mandelate racemase [Hyphomicrobiales bacterium]
MVPRWFDERADQTNADTVNTLRQSILQACKSAKDLNGSTTHICATVHLDVLEKMPKVTPALAAGFGPALVEMALIDAVCQAAECNFFDGARQDIFGLTERSGPGLSERMISQGLSSIRPKWTMQIRHTVGADAPLYPADAEPLVNDDGPVALQDVMDRTGISAFKIKLKGNVDNDLKRLMAIAPLLEHCKNLAVTLDANEQYSADAFPVFLKGFQSTSTLAKMRDATLFIEQPFAREIALETEISNDTGTLPLIIDESDDHDGSFAQAWSLGWRGTSVKSCKSVFRALLNFCRVQHFKSEGHEAFLSGEDLTCQPGLCLQQDTLMGAAVGIVHTERNGHHFAGGMQGASNKEISQITQRHSDLYDASGARPALRIDSGHIKFESLNEPGFGSSRSLDVSNDTQILNK